MVITPESFVADASVTTRTPAEIILAPFATIATAAPVGYEVGNPNPPTEYVYGLEVVIDSRKPFWAQGYRTKENALPKPGE